jgi:hypothetical protein
MHGIVPNGGSQIALPKVLKGFGEAGVLEVIEADASGAYRADYSVTLHEAVFASHCAWVVISVCLNFGGPSAYGSVPSDVGFSMDRNADSLLQWHQADLSSTGQLIRS